MSRDSRSGRLAVMAAVLAVATGVAVWQQAGWQGARRTAARLGEELAALRLRRTAMEESLTARRRELEGQRRQSAAETARLAQALKAAEPPAAATRWSEPPAQLPAWDPASPYVWLKKEMLPQFPIQIFDETGQLGEEAAAVFMVPPEVRHRLDAELGRLLEGAQSAEAARAERSEAHLAGIADGEGEKFTVKVPPSPEEGARLRQAFEETLRGHLGAGRAELVQKSGADWLDSHFSQFGSEARIISVLRRPDGTYDIAVKAGLTWFSTGGMTSIADYVPAHLRPLFAPITDRPPTPKAGEP